MEVKFLGVFSCGFSNVVLSSGFGCGANVSIYFGVKSKTRAIKKNASKVFLSMLNYWIVSTLKEGVAF